MTRETKLTLAKALLIVCSIAQLVAPVAMIIWLDRSIEALLEPRSMLAVFGSTLPFAVGAVAAAYWWGKLNLEKGEAK